MEIESIVDKKYSEISLDSLSNKECLIISYLSMLRVNRIIKCICKQKEFAKLSILDSFFVKVRKILFEDDKFDNIEIDNYLDICEELIPVIEDYNYNNKYLTEKEKLIMNQAYSIIEEIFYFISIQSKNIEDINKDSCKSFIFLPAMIIECYLRDKYSFCMNKSGINNNELLINELSRIESDIKDISNKKIIKDKMKEYINLNIIN